MISPVPLEPPVNSTEPDPFNVKSPEPLRAPEKTNELLVETALLDDTTAVLSVVTSAFVDSVPPLRINEPDPNAASPYIVMVPASI